MKKVSKVIIGILWIVTIVLSFYVGMTYHWASTTEMDFSKDFNDIVVEENDMADYTVFIEIPEKYGALKQIPEPIRKTIHKPVFVQKFIVKTLQILGVNIVIAVHKSQPFAV